MGRRSFGNVEKLPSGNWRASWRKGAYTVKAAGTFPKKKQAEEWLAAQQAAFAKGEITAGG